MNKYESMHIELMQKILMSLRDTPLVLKGGTALMLAYHLDRFSEDLDFDSNKQLNLISKIKRSSNNKIKVLAVDERKDTGTVTRYRVIYETEYGKSPLKIEVSYRQRECEIQRYRTKTFGFNVAPLPTIIHQKLLAAYDGEKPRAKVRDLYDLDFIMRRWPVAFNAIDASRLAKYAASITTLEANYSSDYKEDDLISDKISLEKLVLSMHRGAIELKACLSDVQKRIDAIPLLKSSAGAALTYYEHVMKALATGETPQEVDWHHIEIETIKDSIGNNGQSPDSVIEVLFKHSPSAITKYHQEALFDCIYNLADDLQNQYNSRLERLAKEAKKEVK